MSRLLALLAALEHRLDALKWRLRARRRRRGQPLILPYRGFGTPERVFLRGRVLEDRGIVPAAIQDSLWENLANSYRRFMSREIPHARIRVRFQGLEQIVTADAEGFFEVWMELNYPLQPVQPWHQIRLELLEPRQAGKPAVDALGEVFVPSPSASYGVISDIDDTVVESDVGNPLHMARALLLSNARMRLPFRGAAAFYRALHGGSTGHAGNPLFYVSSSPWNLYDLLSDFFRLQNFPAGPLLILRDWGLTDTELLPLENRAHKLDHIRRLLELFGDLPFILIGDTTQQDPEIYQEIASLYPRRILAIYIRDSHPPATRMAEIEALARSAGAAGVPFVLADATLPLAQHAAAHGWIDPGRLTEIAENAEPGETLPRASADPN